MSVHQLQFLAEVLNLYAGAEYGSSPRYAWYEAEQLPELASAIARIIADDPDTYDRSNDEPLW